MATISVELEGKPVKVREEFQELFEVVECGKASVMDLGFGKATDDSNDEHIKNIAMMLCITSEMMGAYVQGRYIVGDVDCLDDLPFTGLTVSIEL